MALHNDTTYMRVLVLVRIVGGEKDGHVVLRKPHGQMSADAIRQFSQNYGVALDEAQLRHLEAEAVRAENAAATGKWFYFAND